MLKCVNVECVIVVPSGFRAIDRGWQKILILILAHLRLALFPKSSLE